MCFSTSHIWHNDKCVHCKIERMQKEHYVEMNNFRSNVQTWEESYNARFVALSKENERLQHEIVWRDSELERMNRRIAHLEMKLAESRQKSLTNWSDVQRYHKALERIANLRNYNGNADIVAIEIAEEALKGVDTTDEV